MMALRRREVYARYLRSIRKGDVEGFGHMVEQIKHEVTNSLMNWLNIYFMNNDKTCTHECWIDSDNKNKGSGSANLNESQDPDDQESGCYSSKTSSKKSSASNNNTGNKFGIQSPSKPRDQKMIKTLFCAGQIWPDWCETILPWVRDGVNPHDLEVFHDLINDRLCVINQGMVEYPSITQIASAAADKQKGFNEAMSNCASQMESISIHNNFPPVAAPQQFQNLPQFTSSQIEVNNPTYLSTECLQQNQMMSTMPPPQYFPTQYQFLQPPPGPGQHVQQMNMPRLGMNDPQNGGLAAMGKWYSVPNIIVQ